MRNIKELEDEGIGNWHYIMWNMLVCLPKVVPKCNELDECLGPSPPMQMSNTVGKLQYRLLLSQCQPETFGCFLFHIFCVCHWRRNYLLWILKSRRNKPIPGGRLNDCVSLFFKISPDTGKDCPVDFYFFRWVPTATKNACSEFCLINLPGQ